jgi:hypothetical protein
VKRLALVIAATAALAGSAPARATVPTCSDTIAVDVNCYDYDFDTWCTVRVGGPAIGTAFCVLPY